MPILRPCKCRFHLGFSLVTKVRDSGKDFNGLSSSGNSNSESIWSDGTTMWAADVIDAKVYAYDMATKARVPRKDFDTVVKMVDFSHRPQSAKPLRRPNSSRRLRPGLSPRNTELIPAQATPRASARGTA